MGGFKGVKCVLVGWNQGDSVCTGWVESRGLSVYWLGGLKGLSVYRLGGFKRVKYVLVGWVQGGISVYWLG